MIVKPLASNAAFCSSCHPSKSASASSSGSKIVQLILRSLFFILAGYHNGIVVPNQPDQGEFELALVGVDSVCVRSDTLRSANLVFSYQPTFDWRGILLVASLLHVYFLQILPVDQAKKYF